MRAGRDPRTARERHRTGTFLLAAAILLSVLSILPREKTRSDSIETRGAPAGSGSGEAADQSRGGEKRAWNDTWPGSPGYVETRAVGVTVWRVEAFVNDTDGNLTGDDLLDPYNIDDLIDFYWEGSISGRALPDVDITYGSPYELEYVNPDDPYYQFGVLHGSGGVEGNVIYWNDHHQGDLTFHIRGKDWDLIEDDDLGLLETAWSPVTDYTFLRGTSQSNPIYSPAGDWQLIYSVQVEAPPNTPTPLEPAEGARVYVPNPLFRWEFNPGDQPTQSAFYVDLDTDLNPATSEPQYDSGVVTSPTGQWRAPDLPAGTYGWRVATRDKNGAWSPFSKMRRFVVDLSPPPVRIESPRPGDVLSGIAELEGWCNASDAVSADGMLFQVSNDGENWTTVGQDTDTTDAFFSCRWDTKQVQDGPGWRARVQVRNKVGLLSEDETEGTFTVDNIIFDAIRLDSPKGGENWTGVRKVRWTTHGVQAYSDLRVCLWTNLSTGGAGRIVHAGANASAGSFEWNTTGWENGTYVLTAQLYTDAGGFTDVVGLATSEPFVIWHPPFNHPPAVEVLSPESGGRYAGAVDILWHAADPDGHPLEFEIALRSPSGDLIPAGTGRLGEFSVGTDVQGAYAYTWDLSGVPAGTGYTAVVTAFDIPPLGESKSARDESGPFEVYHRSFNPPTIALLAPSANDTLSGTVTVRWSASDPDEEDDVTVSLFYSHDDGASWIVMPGAFGLTNSGSFDWDTRADPILTPNGNSYRIRAVATDTSPLKQKAEAVSERLRLLNNNAPVAYILTPKPPAVAKVGESVAFSGDGSSDPDGDNITYLWEFGDHTTAEGESVRHTFTEDGSYVVVLVVRDVHGLEGRASVRINVSSGSVLLSLEPMDWSPKVVREGDVVLFHVRLRNDGTDGAYQLDAALLIDSERVNGTTVPGIDGGQRFDLYLGWRAVKGNYTVTVRVGALSASSEIRVLGRDEKQPNDQTKSGEAGGKVPWSWVGIGLLVMSVLGLAVVMAIFVMRRREEAEGYDDVGEERTLAAGMFESAPDPADREPAHVEPYRAPPHRAEPPVDALPGNAGGEPLGVPTPPIQAVPASGPGPEHRMSGAAPGDRPYRGRATPRGRAQPRRGPGSRSDRPHGARRESVETQIGTRPRGFELEPIGRRTSGYALEPTFQSVEGAAPPSRRGGISEVDRLLARAGKAKGVDAPSDAPRRKAGPRPAEGWNAQLRFRE